MGSLECAWRCPSSQLYTSFSPLPSTSFCAKTSTPSVSPRKNLLLLSPLSPTRNSIRIHIALRPVCALPDNQQSESIDDYEEEEVIAYNSGQGNSTIILSSCLVGLLTGIGVVLFNNGVSPSFFFLLVVLSLLI